MADCIVKQAVELNDYGDTSLGAGASVTLDFSRGFIVVVRHHSTASLNVFTVFCKKGAIIQKIFDGGAATNVIAVSATDYTVTITNNHAVACYYYTLGK